MLKINAGDKRTLEFEVSIQGIDYKLLEGYFAINVDGVSYGFPVNIKEDVIKVKIPPLQDVIKGLHNKDVVEAKLNIFGNDFYLNPWTDNIQITSPVKMEAAIKVDSDDDDKKVKVVLKEPPLSDGSYKIEPKPAPEELKNTKSTLGEAEKEKILNNLFDRLNSKYNVQSIKESSKPDKISEAVDKVLGIKKKQKQMVESHKPVVQKQMVKKSQVEEAKDPISLMESLGMKNPRTQEAMLERARSLGGDDNILDTLKSMLLGKEQNPYEHFINKDKS